MRGCRVSGSILISLFMIALSPGPCFSLETTKIDWLQGYVSAVGQGYARKTGTPIDAENAIDAAKAVAQSELLEAVKGVMVDTQTAVSDLMTEKTDTSVRVRGVLQGATFVGEPQIKESNGFVIATVEVRVCLYKGGVGCASDRTLAGVLVKPSGKSNGKSEGCSLLPNIRSTQEILSKVTYDTNAALKLFVINLNGKVYNAELSDFVIGYEGEQGQRCYLYGPGKVDPVIRRDHGIGEKFFHVSDAKRKYGPNIVIVEAKSIDNGNYIVIDSTDAYLLNLINENGNNSIFYGAKLGITLDK
jgi:hypothetical protein